NRSHLSQAGTVQISYVLTIYFILQEQNNDEFVQKDLPISKNIFCHIIAYYNRSPKQGVIFVMRLASTPQYKAKIHKILFSSVDCVIQLGNCI
ncbi:hypothetical protein ACR76N_15315, partial [Phocaeicola vulgatus]|uniref:hypothetical protein n=4 Tax=Phocaeicola TaxID=909656 RepID=UPI003DA6CB9D